MSRTVKVALFLQCYNHRPWLQQSIETALAQRADGAEIEIEVVDDGSTDGSIEAIERLAQGGRFLFRHQANRGLVATLEEQFAQCDADYICIQSTDDFWDPQKLSIQLDWMKKHPELPISFTQALSVDSHGHPLPKRSQLFMLPTPERISFEEIFLGKVGLCGASALIRREALQGPRFFPTPMLAEDFYLWLEISRRLGDVGMLRRPLSYYRIHGENLHHNTLPLAEDILKTVDRHSDHPLHGQARRRWHGSFFSEIASENRTEALRFWRAHPSATSDTFKGLAKLFLPRGVWHRWKPL